MMKIEEDLWPMVLDEETFVEAWRKVKANMGGPGVDRVSLKEFESSLSSNLTLLRELLKEGIYQPLPLKIKEIEQGEAKQRTLKIPSIRDRIVQEAVLIVIQPLIDQKFLDCCYGYRPNRSAHMAIKRIERNLKKDKHWVVEVDIEDFFDTVNQNQLLNWLSEWISDHKIIRLIKEWIGFSSGNEIGIPQGAVISPLLANVYLHYLDSQMIKGPGHYIRYCDDFIILCNSEEEARKALEKAERCLSEGLFLRINQEKTRISHIKDGFIFLGFLFTEEGKRPSPKAIERLKLKVEKELELPHAFFNEELTKKLKLIIRGWQNYYQLNTYEQADLVKEIERSIQSQNESIPLHILRAALCIEKGEEQAAYETIKKTIELPSDDEEIHYQCGILCESLGMEEEAREEFLKAIKIKPDYKDGLYHLGVNYFKEGKVEKAIRFLQKASQLSPQSSEVYVALALAFEKWGLHGAAHKAFSRAIELNPDLRAKFPSSKRRCSMEGEEIKFTSFKEEDLDLYLRLFTGREGVHARQWVDEGGKSGYYPVTRPICREDIRAHLEGRVTLGLYLVRIDNTVKVGVIDIDISKKTFREDPDSSTEWQNLVQKDANRVVESFQNVGIPVYMEISGRKGIHCWLFFEQPARTTEVRNLLKEVLRTIGPPPAGIYREMFPKQDYVNRESLGCLIKLPLGVHMVSNKRTYFIDKEGNPYENQIGFLWQIRSISIDKFREVISRNRFQKEGESILIEDSNVNKLMGKCNVLRFLREKAKKERDLTHSERLVLLHTLGHLGEAGRKAIHQIIGQCLNYNFDRTEKWMKRIHNFPLSCPRIREWLSDITPAIGCYCEFPMLEKGYPSPILHVDLDGITKTQQRLKAEKIEIKQEQIMQENKTQSALVINENETNSRSGEKPEELVKTYIQLKKDRKNIEEKIKETEKRLKHLFDSIGKESIPIDIGNLTLVTKGEKTIFLIEL